MKKSIIAIEQKKSEPAEFEQEYELAGDSPSESEDTEVVYSNISLSGLISYLFIFILIGAIAMKFIFPTINSFEANMTHKKIGKSIVANYFNLLENAQYDDALKLLDATDTNNSMDSLLNSIQNEFGGNKIVDYNIVDVIDNEDYSIVNTLVSVSNNGQIIQKDKSFLVKDTPKGWKISLSGLIKKFRLEPAKLSFNGKYTITAQDIEYCVEGINLALKVENCTYRKIDVKGNMKLCIADGPYCPADFITTLKSRVIYKHNVLFEGLTGEPTELIVTTNADPYNTYRMPINIIE